MIFWSFFGTMSYTKDNFCFHESILQWQIKLISHRNEFWHLWRKPTVIFSKIDIFSKFFDELGLTYYGKMQVKRSGKLFCELFTNDFFRYTFVTFELRQTIAFKKLLPNIEKVTTKRQVILETNFDLLWSICWISKPNTKYEY